MMQNTIELVVFLAGVLWKASCDPYRIVLIEEHKTWTEAQSYCREKHTDLATVQSDEDRAKLKQAASAVNFTSDAWVGFYRHVWLWSYKSTLMSNAKWDMLQPDMPDTDGVCGAVFRNERWGDRYCAQQDNFFCQTDNQSTLQDKFQHIETLMNFHDAQIYCRTHHTDLAAVADDTENTVLANILSSHSLNDAWFGLYKVPPQWLWSDNSSVWWSSVRWRPGQTDNANANECTRADPDGLMTADTCSTPLPFYCRQNMKIQRVRVTVRSDGHLDQSAVMEAIQKKMEQILSDQDMKVRSSITWSVQPDGKIFQRQNTLNTRETTCELYIQ